MPPLRLALLSSTMDARRLTCVVMPTGECAVLEIRNRDAKVSKLLLDLLSKLHLVDDDYDSPVELVRALDADKQWLLSNSIDHRNLMYGDRKSALRRFVTRDNIMHPMDLVHRHFPQQPSIHEGTATVIHILVHMIDTTPAPEPIASPSPVDGETAKLLHALNHAKVEAVRLPGKSRAQSRALAIRAEDDDQRLWLGDSGAQYSKMYVPSQWVALAGEVLRWVMDGEVQLKHRSVGPRVYLTGAPRSGKSAFLGYLLYYIVNAPTTCKAPRCVVDVPGVTFALVDRASGVVIEGERGIDFINALKCTDTLYIFDATAEGQTSLDGKTVRAKMLTVVPERFHTISNKRTRTLALPSWSQEDVRSCWGSCYRESGYNVKEAIPLYRMWGGLPGRLFGRDAVASVQDLEDAMAELTSTKVLRALRELKESGHWMKNAEDQAWAPLMVAVTDTECIHDGQVAFCSQYVCDRAIELITARTCVVRQCMAPCMPLLWKQISLSLDYLTQEEEEKESEPVHPARFQWAPVHRDHTSAFESDVDFDSL